MKRISWQTIHQVVCTVISTCISTDAIEDTMKRRLFLLISKICQIFLGFFFFIENFKLHDKHNIRTLSVKINVTYTEILAKGSPFWMFLKLLQISLKYINNIHVILYISPREVTCNLHVCCSLLLTLSCAFVLGTSRRRKVDNKDQLIQGNILITDTNYNVS